MNQFKQNPPRQKKFLQNFSTSFLNHNILKKITYMKIEVLCRSETRLKKIESSPAESHRNWIGFGCYLLFLELRVKTGFSSF